MLELTPRTKVHERSALRINPAKTCQPVGALYAALGVHACLPHSHGSQGCVSFHRMFLTRHFKEPAMASTSAFTEGASVFGGGSNLTNSVRNIFDTYDPDLIAIHTTCLSETIGDDLNAIVGGMDIPEGKYVVYCNTPSYAGSHVTGFSNMVAGFIRHLAIKSAEGAEPGTATADGAASATELGADTEAAAGAEATSERLALFPGFVNPGDMREIRRIAHAFGIEHTLLPDTSGVLDAPMTGRFELYPKGGTPVADVIALGDAKASIALGEAASFAGANELRKKCGVTETVLGLPIGVRATDAFVMALREFSQSEVPACLEEERGQLVDILIDTHPYLDGRTCAIYGDPDTILGLTSATLEMGMIPAYVFTTSPYPNMVKQCTALFEEYGCAERCLAKDGADLFELHQRLMHEPVDVLIGGSYGKQIARAENIPLVRVGFPIIDRYVHSYLPIVGYRGGMRLAELISNALLDRYDESCAEEEFELVL
jgi:nitrogenase molybdenum-iron protein beta chain